MISIFITTRNNAKSLQRVLDSINLNVSNYNNVEIVIGYDLSDTQTQDFLESYIFNYGGNNDIKITKLGFKWTSSTSVNKDILPFLVERARGQYLWLLSDEVEIRTKNFDSIMENSMTSFLQTKQDTLLCVKTNEQSKNVNDYKHPSMKNRTERNWFKFDYAIFPLITRQVYDTLGYLVPADLSIDAAKILLAKVFHSSLANRFFNIPEVVVYNHDENAGTDIERFQGIDTYFLKTGVVGVSKLDDVVHSNLASEVNPLSAIVMYMSVTCKVCSSEILIPVNTINPNMTICSNCHCRNAIPQLVPDTARSLTMAANDLTDQLMLASNTKALSAIENNVDNSNDAFKPHINTDPTMMGDSTQDTDDDISALQREAANYIESSDSNSEKSVLDDYAMKQNDSATLAVSTQSAQDELNPIQQQAVKDMVNDILNQKAISSEKNDSVSSASSILEQSVQDVLMNEKADPMNEKDYSDAQAFVNIPFASFVRRESKPGICVAEIGVWLGRTTALYIESIHEQQGKMYAVDLFNGWYPHTHGNEDPNHLEKFLSNISPYESCVEVLKGLSESQISKIPDNSLDICFIDSDHRYDMVKKDIELCIPKMKSGGVLCGHDCESFEHVNTFTEVELNSDFTVEKNCHAGVVQAVFDFFGRVSVKLSYNNWFVQL